MHINTLPPRLVLLTVFIGMLCLNSGHTWARETEKETNNFSKSSSFSSGVATTPSPLTARPRYISVCLWNVEVGDVYLPVMEKAAAAGINSFQINVNWERIYAYRGAKPNWDQYDKQIAMAKKLGCKIFIRIWVARHNDQEWWPSSTIPISNLGLKRGILSGFSFSDENAVAEAEAFVKEVCQRYLPEQQAGHIINVSVANNNDSELGYAITVFNPAVGKETLQVNDYSEHSVRAFNVWLQNKYKTIANLNKQWSSDFSTFNIYPPGGKEYWEPFAFNSGMDWYLFRHHELKTYSDRLARAIKSVDPSYKYLLDVGSVYDGISITRATYGFKSLAQLADGGIKVNDGFYYNHRFAIDLLRTNLPGKMIGNEVFRAAEYPDEMDIYRRYFNESFEHGADWINMVGFDRLVVYPACEAIMKEMTAKWLTTTVPDITPAASITYTMTEAIRQSLWPRESEYKDLYNVHKKPLAIYLQEDLLGETNVENKAPKVVTAIPNQKATAGNWFQYAIPKGNFLDEDGFLVGVEAQGLPEGLLLNSWSIEGRPLKTGEFPVTLKVIDNGGASVSTTFTLTVTVQETANLVSLYKAGNYLTRRFLRYIQDGDTLRGAEVTQTVNILTSPRTGTVGSYAYGMVGPYTISSIDSKEPYGLFGDNGGLTLVPGKYTLTVKSYSSADMLGSLLNQQVVNFVVAEGEGSSNQAPFLYKQPIGLLAKAGEYFEYRLHDSTFVDLDGTISAISITSLPDGLTGDQLLIKGTPAKKGYWTVQVKATDNQGASTSAQFMFMVTADNAPPVIQKIIPDMVAYVNKPFTYRIPDSTFVDTDGTIKNITMLGAPDGLTAAGSLLSGVPKTLGSYQLIAIATDDGNASAQMFFKVTVLPEGEAPNKSPEINKPLLSLQALAGEAFQYRLPDSTFVDLDGTVASIAMTSLPDGLVWDGAVIKGTPTKKGEWTVQVKAVDNRGASVTAQFKFIITAENLPPMAQKSIPELVAVINQPYSYRLPDSTFVDSDGTISKITILGAPAGLKATNDTLSGTPTALGTFQLTATATDNEGATTQMGFTLTVVKDNEPPVVAKKIPDQRGQAGVAFSYTVPDSTFSDPDGTVARMEITGLPAGLSSSGGKISGVPADSGTYVITVKGIDPVGASVTTTFKLFLAAPNAAPQLTKELPNLLAIVGQVFYFDVKEYFKDEDGQIESIAYASALPPGLTANASQLAGNPTAAGTYEVKVRVKDDKGAVTEKILKIKVERPVLFVDLYKAGNEETRKAIHRLVNGDIIDITKLPEAVNIFVSSNAKLTSVTMDITGAVAINHTDAIPPLFSLYGDEAGFKALVGTYRLKVTAYRDGVLVASQTISFDIIKAGSSTVREGVAEVEMEPDLVVDPWIAFPNPFLDRVQLRTETGASVEDIEVLSGDGRSRPLSTSHWIMNGNALEVDLSEVATAPGLYLMRIRETNGKQRTIKLLKSNSTN